MSAWATTIISGLVLVVAFMQWRTAHQKVMLDLFERRLSIIETAEKAARLTLKENEPDFETASKLAIEATIRAKFLFGPDVFDLLDDFRKHIYRATEWGGLMGHALSVDLEKAGKASSRRLLENLPVLARPYILMDQKRVRTPAEWLQDRNRFRLSRADEKQK